jgi:hypothetical protein
MKYLTQPRCLFILGMPSPRSLCHAADSSILGRCAENDEIQGGAMPYHQRISNSHETCGSPSRRSSDVLERNDTNTQNQATCSLTQSIMQSDLFY